MVPAVLKDGDYVPMTHHVPNAWCPCHPTVEYVTDGEEELLIIHEVIH